MKKEVKIGLYALIVLVALYWGINFLRGRDIFSRSNVYYAEYEQVTGLQKSASVTAKGVKIGVVSEIIYNPSESEHVRIALSIDSKLDIPENSQARIYSTGIMGGKEIEIIFGNSSTPLEDGDTIHANIEAGLLETAGNDLADLSQKLSQTADNATKLLETITALLEENRGNIDATLANVATLSLSLAAEGETLHRTLANVEKFSGTLASSDIDQTLSNINTFSANLAGVDLQRLDNSLKSLDTILAEVRCGQGSLGKLASDDSLYNALTTASSDLALLLQDIRKNPHRYLSFSVFSPKN